MPVVSKAQALELDKIRLVSYNALRGESLYEWLLANPDLWRSAMLIGEPGITLRDLADSDSPFADTLLILWIGDQGSISDEDIVKKAQRLAHAMADQGADLVTIGAFQKKENLFPYQDDVDLATKVNLNRCSYDDVCSALGSWGWDSPLIFVSAWWD